MDKIKDFLKGCRAFLFQWLTLIVMWGIILFALTLFVFYIARVFCFVVDIPMNRNYVFAIEGCIILLAIHVMRTLSK